MADGMTAQSISPLEFVRSCPVDMTTQQVLDAARLAGVPMTSRLVLAARVAMKQQASRQSSAPTSPSSSTPPDLSIVHIARQPSQDAAHNGNANPDPDPDPNPDPDPDPTMKEPRMPPSLKRWPGPDDLPKKLPKKHPGGQPLSEAALFVRKQPDETPWEEVAAAGRAIGLKLSRQAIWRFRWDKWFPARAGFALQNEESWIVGQFPIDTDPKVLHAALEQVGLATTSRALTNILTARRKRETLAALPQRSKTGAYFLVQQVPLDMPVDDVIAHGRKMGLSVSRDSVHKARSYQRKKLGLPPLRKSLRMSDAKPEPEAVVVVRPDVRQNVEPENRSVSALPAPQESEEYAAACFLFRRVAMAIGHVRTAELLALLEAKCAEVGR